MSTVVDQYLVQPPLRVHDSWRHQLQAYWFAFGKRAAMLAMGMGTGKSKVAVDLMVNAEDDRVLICCPRSVLGVWRREIERHARDHFDVLVLDGTQSVKRKAEIAKKHIARATKPCVVVINYESARAPAFANWACTVTWSRVIADESHRLKGAKAKQSKSMYEIGRRARHRLCLTGTVMPHSPMDVFGQYRFLDSSIFGTSYHRFRSHYAISGHFGCDHIVAYKNQDQMADLMRPVTFECRMEDTEIELPEACHNERTVELSKDAARVYRELEGEMIADIQYDVITAANALVKLLRLQQITSGFCETDNEVLHEFGTEKATALEEILEGITEPAVVFCRFRRDLATVREIVNRLGLRYGELSGEQKDLTSHATMRDDVDVMGVQVQSGGVGVDLTRACYAIYWNHPWSLGEYEQSLARVHRPGQTRPVVYYHLLTAGTVDEVVFKALAKKKDVVDVVLNYLRFGGDCI